jgi:hypothetical protein
MMMRTSNYRFFSWRSGGRLQEKVEYLEESVTAKETQVKGFVFPVGLGSHLGKGSLVHSFAGMVFRIS